MAVSSLLCSRSTRANSTALVEGLFAKRLFLPGQMVSYFTGVKTTEERMLGPNPLTKEEEEEVRLQTGGRIPTHL